MTTSYALSYNGLLNAVQNIIVDTGSADFTSIFPVAIQTVESNIYRELDLLAMRGVDDTATLSTSTRLNNIPSTITIVEGIAYISPAVSVPPNATRNVLERTSIDFIDSMYGDETVKGSPIYYALLSDSTYVVAPTSSSAYKVEVTGTLQPAPMSNANQNTLLGNNFPDLLLSGVIIFMSNWQRDAGSAMAPQDMNNWTTMYADQMKSAADWVQRQKSQSPNWNPFSPTPESTPRT